MIALGLNCQCCMPPAPSGVTFQFRSFERSCNNYSDLEDESPCIFDSEIVFPDFKTITEVILESFEFPFTYRTLIAEDQDPPFYNWTGYALKEYSPFGKLKYEVYTKCRLVHTPSPSCYMKVWFIKKILDYTFIPYDPNSGQEISTNYVLEPEPYEWDGTSLSNGLCLANSSKTNTDKENIIIGDEFDLDVGDVDFGYGRSVSIAIRKFSVVKGYEPDEPTLGYPFINDDSGRCNDGEYPRSQCFSG